MALRESEKELFNIYREELMPRVYVFCDTEQKIN